MDIIELAREIGREIQKDEDYIKMRLSVQAIEADEELKKLENEYDIKCAKLQGEAVKPDRDADKLEQLCEEMIPLHRRIIKNINFANYVAAKKKFDVKLQRVLAIINNSAEGDDPETTDYAPESKDN